jgi:steroid delta-isomerase-like uncharacterized protein
MNATELIEAYFAAFNRGDTDSMLAMVSDDIAHHVNEGGTRTGKEAFAEFNAHMVRCYRERLGDIVVFRSADPTRAAAEFTVADGRITRITTYYNLSNWIAQVSS